MKSVLHALCVAAACVLLGARAEGQELLVCNFFSSSVERFDLASGASLGPLGGAMQGPLCARLGPDGDLYAASEGTNSILRYTGPTFAFAGAFVAPGSGGLAAPTGITWGPDGHMYVSSFTGNSVLKFDGKSGAPLGTFVAPGSGGLSGADNGTIFGPDGDLYVPSYNNNRVLKYDGKTGAFEGNFIAAIGKPRVLEFRDDFLYITSETANSVRKYDADTGALLGNLIVPGAGGLSVPIGMVFADDGSLYVSSGGNNRILRYDGTTGAFIDQFAASPGDPINGPTFLTIVPAPSLGAGCAMLVLVGLARRCRRTDANNAVR